MAQSASNLPEQHERLGLGNKHKISPRFLLIALLIVGAGAGIWYWLTRPQSDRLQFSGRIEGYETDVGAKFAGRIQDVTVREGAEVTSGQLLVRMDDEELQAQLRAATATLQSAQQQVANARLQISVLENQMQEAGLSLQQSKGDTAGRITQAEANVASVVAQLRQAEAQVVRSQSDLRLAKINRDRYAQLVQDGAITQQRFDEAQTTLDTTQATLRSQQASVEAARRQVAVAQGQLMQARSADLNPDIRNVQLNRTRTQLEQAKMQLAIAQSAVANAKANRQQIQAQLNDLTIKSPIHGVVTARSVEPGVVVASGRILLSLVNLDTVYLRGFIPEGEIGHVRVGQPAKVYLDSNPDQPLTGHVIAIDAQASFTPENIYFRDDRVQQVFGVRIGLDHPGGFAKPGMPADGTIELPSSQ
jgi:HlyD family secretion protein